METELPVVIPTHGRAGRVTTLDALGFSGRAILCVAASQEAVYREVYPDEQIVVHGDDVRNLSAKRQWMYETFGSFFSVDDDIVSCTNRSAAAGEPSKLRGDELYDWIYRDFETAVGMGVYLWSYAPTTSPRFFDPFRPFRVTGEVRGHATGFVEGSGLWYNQNIESVDDRWMTALNAYMHRMIFVNMRLSFDNKDTFANVGGLASARTVARTRKDREIMIETFGESVIESGIEHSALNMSDEFRDAFFEVILPF